MKRLPTEVVKRRSREVSAEVDSWGDVYDRLVGSMQRCCVVEPAADGVHLVAHCKSYTQVWPLGGATSVPAPAPGHAAAAQWS